MYPGVGGALLLPLLLAVRVCAMEKEETDGLVPIILRTRPVRWVSLRPVRLFMVLASSVIPMLTDSQSCTRGPGARKPSSNGLSQI